MVRLLLGYILLFTNFMQGCMHISEEIKVEYRKPVFTIKNQKYFSEHFNGGNFELIKVNLESKIDLLTFFRNYNRSIQSRCDIYLAKDEAEYMSVVYGPYYNNINISEDWKEEVRDLLDLKPNSSNGEYKYTLYALRDFTAIHNRTGKMRNNDVSLKELNFTKIQCYIIGVTKAPGTFPRTNYLTITYDEFNEIIKK